MRKDGRGCGMRLASFLFKKGKENVEKILGFEKHKERNVQNLE